MYGKKEEKQKHACQKKSMATERKGQKEVPSGGKIGEGGQRYWIFNS